MTGIFVAWPYNPNGTKADRLVGWVEDGAGCHIWTAARERFGYGIVTVNRKNKLAHRVRYEIEVGPIPVGLQLDHFACDNPSCCNPDHLRPVTQLENNIRAIKRKGPRTHCPRGHEMTTENTRRDTFAKRGVRSCLACSREARRKRDRKNAMSKRGSAL